MREENDVCAMVTTQEENPCENPKMLETNSAAMLFLYTINNK